VVAQLNKHDWSNEFKIPVVEAHPELKSHYPRVIARPMDLRTISSKLERGQYRHSREFAGDVDQVFDNAIQYNEAPDEVRRRCVLVRLFVLAMSLTFGVSLSRALSLSIRTPAMSSCLPST
jgi:hypothetical protein